MLALSSNARAINDLDQVVGNAFDTDTSTVPFVWTAATGIQNIGSLGGFNGQARGNNDFGLVVGESTTSSGETHAYVWSREGGMVDLGIPAGGDVYSGARGINARGYIVGQVDTPDGLGLLPVVWIPVAH